MTNDLNDFGRKLKQLREERKVTLEEMEKVLGVTNSAISKWERGEREPKLTNVKMLADYFGVSFSWLAGESDDPRVYTIKSNDVPKLSELHDVIVNVSKDAYESGLTSQEIKEILELAIKLKKKI